MACLFRWQIAGSSTFFRQFDSTVSGHAVSYAVYLQASFFRQFDISGIAG